MNWHLYDPTERSTYPQNNTPLSTYHVTVIRHGSQRRETFHGVYFDSPTRRWLLPNKPRFSDFVRVIAYSEKPLPVYTGLEYGEEPEEAPRVREKYARAKTPMMPSRPLEHDETANAVAEIVSDVTGVPVPLIFAASKRPPHCEARFIAWKLLLDRFGFSKAKIAAVFGRNDSTVSLGLKSYRKLMNEPSVQANFHAVCRRMEGAR